MPMENYTRHQQSIIKNYYKNRDDVAFQRAQELLTELYLAEGKKREKVWESLFKNLERIGVPADQLEHLKAEKKPELIAALLEKKL
jgi:DNA polymerase III delta prime subunit